MCVVQSEWRMPKEWDEGYCSWEREWERVGKSPTFSPITADKQIAPLAHDLAVPLWQADISARIRSSRYFIYADKKQLWQKETVAEVEQLYRLVRA